LIWKREQSTRGRLLSGGVVREPIKTDVLGEDALTDGATITTGYNNYEGGDGNDLTLTVVL
jgi:hypothetical protein